MICYIKYTVYCILQTESIRTSPTILKLSVTKFYPFISSPTSWLSLQVSQQKNMEHRKLFNLEFRNMKFFSDWQIFVDNKWPQSTLNSFWNIQQLLLSESIFDMPLTASCYVTWFWWLSQWLIDLLVLIRTWMMSHDISRKYKKFSSD